MADASLEHWVNFWFARAAKAFARYQVAIAAGAPRSEVADLCAAVSRASLGVREAVAELLSAERAANPPGPTRAVSIPRPAPRRPQHKTTRHIVKHTAFPDLPQIVIVPPAIDIIEVDSLPDDKPVPALESDVDKIATSICAWAYSFSGLRQKRFMRSRRYEGFRR